MLLGYSYVFCGEMLIQIFSPLVCLLLNCMGSLYILDTSLLSDIHNILCEYFVPVYSLPFVFTTVFFFFLVVKGSFFVVCFLIRGMDILSKKYLFT